MRYTAGIDIGSTYTKAVVLSEDDQLAGRGLRVQRHGSGLQLTTAAGAAGDVERYLNLESSVHLTRAALETLAIIAYRQPVTRPMIDSLRGVNSETSLHTLLRYGLIEEIGRGEGPGRPLLRHLQGQDLRHGRAVAVHCQGRGHHARAQRSSRPG